MARLVVGTVGAVIGFWIGGPVGASIGWSLGSLAGGSFERGPTSEGPRLDDLMVQTSTEGAPIPQVWGTWRLAGNVIWSTDLVETRHEEEVGGKGGPSATLVSYTYSCSFAVALCEGAITGVRRIWADGKLIFDVGTGADAATVVASLERANAIRVYTGSETQAADPTIQAHVGAANAPAYRGTALLVFDNLQLADFGNRIPNISAEVVAAGTTTAPRRVTQFAATLPLQSMRFDNGILIGTEFSAAGGFGTLKEHRYTLSGTLIETRTGAPVPTSGGNGAMIRNDPYIIGPMFQFGSHNGVAADSNTWPFLVFSPNNLSNPVVWKAPIPTLPIGETFSAWGRGVASKSHVYLAMRTTSLLVFIVRWDRSDDGGVYGVPIVRGPLVFSGVGPENLGTVSLYWDGSALWDFTYSWTSPITAKTVRKYDADLNLIAEWSGVVSGSSETAVPFTIYDNVVLFPTTTGTRLYRLDAGGTITDITTSSGLTQRSGVIGAINDIPGVLITADGVYSVGPAMGAATVLVSDILSALCQRAGLLASDIDVALLTDSVSGYARTRPMPLRQAIEPLMAWAQIDAVESSGKLKWVKRGASASAVLTDADLVRIEDADAVRVSRSQDTELPATLAILFADADRDHQAGVVRARRLTSASRVEVQQEMPILATTQQAAQAADILMREAWRSRARYEFALPARFARLDPADVITLPVAGQAHTVRLTRMAGAPGAEIRCEAVSESQTAYTSAAVGTDAALWQAQAIGFSGPTAGVLLDLPALRDQDDDAGLYLAAAGYLAGWRGSLLYRSSDGGATWVQAETLLAGASLGVATTALAAGRTDLFDEANSVTVQLTAPSAALASASELSVLNGANACALGAHGRWEILQFRSATQNGDGTWTVSGLLRGRKGTEWAVGTHLIGDTFVLLSSATMRRLAQQSADIGAERKYRFATLGQPVESAAVQSMTYAGVALEPYAPVLLGGGRNAAGDITINWTRRARIAGDWRDLVDVPLSEASESYEVEIWTAGFAALKRTLTGLTTPTTTYTTSQQTTDFGSNQASVAVRVYQLSAAAGRGYALQGTV